MFQQQVKVLFNQRIGPGYYKIGLTCPEHFAMAKAGQFIMLRFAQPAQPLLRRPFSIHNLILTNGMVAGLEVLYKVVGQGTRLLAGQVAGDTVDIHATLNEQISNAYYMTGKMILDGKLATRLDFACSLAQPQRAGAGE